MNNNNIYVISHKYSEGHICAPYIRSVNTTRSLRYQSMTMPRRAKIIVHGIISERKASKT
jgi:hypothetical protein